METAPESVSDDISPPKQNEPANVAKANKLDELSNPGKRRPRTAKKIFHPKIRRNCELR
jgi:hypothetical protein